MVFENRFANKYQFTIYIQFIINKKPAQDCTGFLYNS